MRAAVCMYGLVGGKTGKNGQGGVADYRYCHEYLQRHVIRLNKADVFMHTWSVDYEQPLRELYQPKKSIFEPQRTFGLEGHEWERLITKSRWYSHKQTLALKEEYEREQGFVYDWVMVCRFDLAFYVDFEFEQLEPGKFCASHFNDVSNKKTPEPNRLNHTLKSRRYLDLWFVGPSDFMDKFGKLYDHYDEYFFGGGAKSYDSHKACYDYVASFAGNPLDATQFKFYRWFDYELYRMKPSPDTPRPVSK